jgi:hypothetical protein
MVELATGTRKGQNREITGKIVTELKMPTDHTLLRKIKRKNVQYPFLRVFHIKQNIHFDKPDL